MGIPGDNKKNKPVWVPPTLTEVIDWINARSYPDEVKEELIKRASRYPGHALRGFVKNIESQIAGIQSKRRKDQADG